MCLVSLSILVGICHFLVFVGNHFLTCCFSPSAAPANLSDAEGSSSRLECILRAGEIISATTTSAKGFAAKFFPCNSDPVDLDQTVSMLNRATEEHNNILCSVARGGVKVALAMLWA